MKRKDFKTRAIQEWTKGTALLSSAFLIYLDVNARQVVMGIIGFMLIIFSYLDYHVYLKKKGYTNK